MDGMHFLLSQSTALLQQLIDKCTIENIAVLMDEDAHAQKQGSVVVSLPTSSSISAAMLPKRSSANSPNNQEVHSAKRCAFMWNKH